VFSFDTLLRAGADELLAIFSATRSTESLDADLRREQLAQQLGLRVPQLLCGLGFNAAVPGLEAVQRALGFTHFEALVAARNYAFIHDVYRALTINNIVESDYAIYNVKVSDACTGILTAGAHLYPVSPPPTGDCYANCDFSTVFPFLNANDFQCFLGVFAAGMSRANCDGSTAGPMLTANDFQCFLNKFSAGCSAP